MANPSRKMVTIRRIDRVDPIDGADRIEVATVGGWRVVVQKGEFKAGDLALYHEIDSFIDTSRPAYSFLDATKEMVIDGETRMGHVLRTRKMRGVYSQGLLLKPEVGMPKSIPTSRYAEMCEEKTNVSGLVGVVEYHKPMPNADFVGGYDPYVAPRTDAERIQNISDETFDLIAFADYETSIKVDGTSITMLWDERTGGIRIFSHNNEFSLERGMGKLVFEVAEKQGLIAFCESNPMITVQAELCGPKIQSNRLRLKEHRLFVFSLWDVKEGKYIQSGYGLKDVRAIRNSHVPYVRVPLNTDVLSWVDGIRGYVTAGCLDEGVVIHVYSKGALTDEEWGTLKDALGQTMQVKAVSNRYLLKAKE